ncbi:MAG: substrate-binding domain-containing protein [Planctomycetaceae bacterium]|nr:substrate-binding domain-containing protein [Planctomycetaceae bacterium]
MKRSPREIALLIVPNSDNQVRMIRGVMEYARECGDFQITKHAAIPYVPWSLIDRVECDGVIAYAESPEQVELLRGLSVPVVNLTMHTQPANDLPVVHSDNKMIGQLAAEHLLSTGLSEFAVVGHFAWHHNMLRRDGFINGLAEHGCQPHVIDVDFESETTGDLSIRRVDQQRLCEALQSIPTPFGVFATHDEFSYEVVEACGQADRTVPYDVAVIGVNDYRLVCESTVPPLSSIAQNSERIGYLAAKLVDELIAGAECPSSPICVAPERLIVRRSSAYLALDDSELVQVVRYIREHCHLPITAEDIALQFQLSRRTLDDRFKAALGHSVSKELRVARIRTARELLTTTQLRIVDVGVRCGFDSTSGFVRAFRECTGMTPGQVRRGEPPESAESLD